MHLTYNVSTTLNIQPARRRVFRPNGFAYIFWAPSLLLQLDL